MKTRYFMTLAGARVEITKERADQIKALQAKIKAQRAKVENTATKHGLQTYDDGKCDFYANGFDCRDCSLAGSCENFRNFDD